ncbi:hypothetical protein [Pseudonocardia hydrocarbonoxydans]|uniref:Uncharacterized protein n=1 Tax=Pseudonocardia hydrocarbonoxydans TaxID=76726 RepID=A0A4Y3WM11_9PSEU|nr:hypothetical protein [Pseudonocardia hydrocarbonoxydans]GEC19987.1 hypothetical protein PHY01_22700 [Pseudonocardia hydrocarbonoxydans]
MDGFQDEMARMAEHAVELVRGHRGGTLDFSARSLADVEDMQEDATEWYAAFDEDQAVKFVQWFGCYVLEVGRRELGGQYSRHGEHAQPVLVVGEPEFRVAMITWDRVRAGSPVDEAGNVPFFYEGFAERARRGRPGDDVLYV